MNEPIPPATCGICGARIHPGFEKTGRCAYCRIVKEVKLFDPIDYGRKAPRYMDGVEVEED